MAKKIRRIVLGVLATVVGVGAILRFFFGMQIVLDGGGSPHVRFVESSSEQAARIEQHRAAQGATPQESQESGVRNQESAEKVIEPAPVQPVPVEPAPSLSKVEASAPPVFWWTDFRGPRRDGAYAGPVNTKWPAGEIGGWIEELIDADSLRSS